MRPLTDDLPKPLLPVGGEPLIVHLIRGLALAGIRDLVINHAHLGVRIVEALGSGNQLGVSIRYSHESEGGLETGGGIVQALPLIDSDPFLVVNGDIWTDFPFSSLPGRLEGDLAHLVLVNNPPHHPNGDFTLRDGRVGIGHKGRLTFSGIGLYARALFANRQPGKFPLAPMLRAAIDEGRIRGEHYRGQWYDVGTPDRLAELDSRFQGS